LDKSNEAFINQDFATSNGKTPTTPSNNNNSASTYYTSSSDGNASDFSFLNRKFSPDEFGSEIEDLTEKAAEKSPALH
jgi:hypothetical protein